MIILRIKKDDKECATLECGKGSFRFGGDYDKDFKKFLDESLAGGIPVPQHVYSEDGGRSVFIKMVVEKESVEPYMLRDFLHENDFTVFENHPEVESEIVDRLTEVPDGMEKQEFLKKLKTMSHLEQTAFLEKLQEIDEEE